MAVTTRSAVGIHTNNARLGQDGVKRTFDTLGTKAKAIEDGLTAGGATRWGALPSAAEVAPQGVVLHVVGEFGATFCAGDRLLTRVTLLGGRVTATIEKEDDLFATL